MTAAQQTAPDQPRVILPTDMHNDCGLIAAAAWSYLTKHGVKSRILNIRYGEDDGHTIVVYESAFRLSTYDHEGSLLFDETATWEMPAILLARAWVKANKVKKKPTDAKWF